MEGSLLFVLCLLLGSLRIVFTGTGGELCRAWNYGLDPLLGPFQCPERLDDTDARFCCGTCSAPYCCSSGEARLDPAQCSLAAPPKEEADPALPSPAPPLVGQESNTWLVGVFWFVVVIILVGALQCICHRAEVLNRLKSGTWGIHGEEAEPAELDNLRALPRQTPQAMSFDPPPPYDSCVGTMPLPLEPPPSYSSLDLTGSGSTPFHRSSEETPPEKVAMVPSKPLPSRRDSRSSLETSV